MTKNESDLYRIGLNLGHNGSIVLLAPNGDSIRLEEEKIIQQKGFYGFPRQATTLVKRKMNLGFNTKVFIGGTQIHEYFPTHRLLRKYFYDSRTFDFHYLMFDFIKLIYPRTKLLHKTLRSHLLKRVRKSFDKVEDIQFIDHHTAHAYSAVLDSGFDKAIVFTQDGKGDSSSGKVFLWRDHKLVEIYSQPTHESLGLIYGAVTKAIGFRQLRHEGKITGLAAFGSVNQELVDAIAKNRKEILHLVHKFSKDRKCDRSKTKELIGKRLLDPDLRLYGEMFQFWVNFFQKELVSLSREDVSATVQFFVEQEILQNMRKFNLEYPEFSKMALAGGLFANVKLNQRIWDSGMFECLFVAPAMDDAGIALGALGADSEVLQVEPTLNKIIFRGESDFSQEEFSDISKTKFESDENLADFIAESILKNRIIGTCIGDLEWGPRSLGHRSILASAFNPDVTKQLNSRLRRNDFMPFAPMVLEEDMWDLFPKYSSNLVATRFMTVTLDVNEKFMDKIPSVVHVDGTARPQVIDSSSPKIIRLILERIKVEKGLGVCINTSFNLHELPILFAFETAIQNLKLGAVDLVLSEDNCVYTKSSKNS